MVELRPVELKLLRLILDSSATAGEAETGRQKLVESLERRGVSGHDIVEALSQSTEQIAVPPKISKPDYGLCKMPFGDTKGKRFMELVPSELRRARDWAMHTPELARKFAWFIHDVDEFLKQ